MKNNTQKRSEVRSADFEAVDLSFSDPEWVKITINFSQDEVMCASKLTQREQMLCILSVLLSCQGMGTYRNMLQAALKSGLEPVAVKETVYQAKAYLGIGRVYDFLVATNEVSEKCGVALPLALQATVSADTRFDDGLSKQIALFGPDIEKQQTEAPALRRNVNRWLAANCFGDYYTRNGLNDQEREMISFWFILAQGGCENQLRGHTADNLLVGNDIAKLYSVVEQCLPYIGYPRALNAMNIIDDVSEQFTR